MGNTWSSTRRVQSWRIAAVYAAAALGWLGMMAHRTREPADSDAGKIGRWTMFYLAVRLAGYSLWRNDLFRGYTKRSYATSILTQSVLIPMAYAYLWRHSTAPFLSEEWFKRAWDGDGDTTAEREIHAMLIAYLVSDVTNLGVSPAFGKFLLLHHALGCAVPLVTMHMPGAIGYSALNILLMEFGSLWFSLADVVGHTRPVLWVRLVWYTLSRVFSIYNTVGIARVLPWKWGAAVCTPAALLTVNNMISSLRMARSLLSSTKSAEKNR